MFNCLLPRLSFCQCIQLSFVRVNSRSLLQEQCEQNSIAVLLISLFWCPIANSYLLIRLHFIVSIYFSHSYSYYCWCFKLNAFSLFELILFQNILEKFNPGARQLISAGKAYLKALHGKFTLFHFIFSIKMLLSLCIWFGNTIGSSSPQDRLNLWKFFPLKIYSVLLN